MLEPPRSSHRRFCIVSEGRQNDLLPSKKRNSAQDSWVGRRISHFSIRNIIFARCCRPWLRQNMFMPTFSQTFLDSTMSPDGTDQGMATTVGSWRQTRDRLGLNIEAKDAAEAITTIREAEIVGVTQVWVTSGGARLADILTLYAAAAAQTSRVRLGTSIVPIYPRHPLVMAHQALAIDDIAPGRLRLGIGVSHRSPNEQMYGISMTSSPFGISERIHGNP